MYVCMCVFMYVCTYLWHVYIHMYMCVHDECVCMYLCVCICSVYIHMYLRVFIYVCMGVCVCMCSITSNILQLHGLQPASLLCPSDSPGKSTGMGCHFFIQEISPTQGSNLRLLHWQADSLLLSHLGSPRMYVLMCK